MTLGRRVAVALVVPLFLLGLGFILGVVALDRGLSALLGGRLGRFPRDARALLRRRAWCIARLRAGGLLAADAEVLSFAVEPFKRGEAFRSSLSRVCLTAQSPGASAPQALECLAKFAPTAGSLFARAIFVLQKNHTNEVGFYRHLASATPGIAPRVYHAAASPLTGHFVLLLEKVPDVVEHSEEAGCPLESARAALATLARFHAHHWIDAKPAPCLRARAREGRAAAAQERFPPPVAGVSIDFACALAWGKRRRVLRRLARETWHEGNRAQTIVHGDARVGNMLFPRGGTPILIDWQAVRWGRAAYDVAYFLLLSLTSELRVTHEAELLASYHAALVAHGVSDLALDALAEDYRVSQLLVGSLLVVPLLGGEVNIDDSNRARIVSGGLAWNERLQRAASDFDTAWLARRFGVDAATFAKTVADATLHPPRLNRPARLVAAELARRRPA